jgi:hypothetical protein
LGEVLNAQADAKSALHTDDSLANLSVGKAFAEHKSVAHSLGEHVSKHGLAHTQTVESFFAILKRGVTGTFHTRFCGFVAAPSDFVVWVGLLVIGIP